MGFYVSAYLRTSAKYNCVDLSSDFNLFPSNISAQAKGDQHASVCVQ
jgi:hypothetical protein